MDDQEKLGDHLWRILRLAESRLGSTAPNPSVAACAVSSSGEILSIQFHPGAGHPHAEALVIEDCRKKNVLSQIETLLVTLEPCNHFGRTGPCTQAILQAGIPHVIAITPDPNPKVAGHGIDFLVSQGVRAEFVNDPALEHAGRHLIRAFSHQIRTGLPWVTIKQAFDESGSMIPPAGHRTFTSPDSLRFAHELRKRADAILTGSGTVLADLPEFTVRHVPDHPGKIRTLVVIDRRGRITQQASDWMRRQETLGFRVKISGNFEEALSILGAEGVLEVLVEAGPKLSGAILKAGLWNERVVIRKTASEPDQIEMTFRS